MENFTKSPLNANDQERARNVLGWLGLTLRDLRDKKVLDVGAGAGQISALAKANGLDVVAIDKNPFLWNKYNGIKEEATYVVGDARQLPFAGNSFDLIIAFAAPPTTWTDAPELVKKTLSEYYRCLKPGGEIRFGDGLGIIEHGGYKIPMGIFQMFFSSQEAKDRERSFAFLKSLYSDITRHEYARGAEERDGFSPHYYIIRKPQINDSKYETQD